MAHVFLCQTLYCAFADEEGSLWQCAWLLKVVNRHASADMFSYYILSYSVWQASSNVEIILHSRSDLGVPLALLSPFPITHNPKARSFYCHNESDRIGLAEIWCTQRKTGVALIIAAMPLEEEALFKTVRQRCDILEWSGTNLSRLCLTWKAAIPITWLSCLFRLLMEELVNSIERVPKAQSASTWKNKEVQR